MSHMIRNLNNKIRKIEQINSQRIKNIKGKIRSSRNQKMGQKLFTSAKIKIRNPLEEIQIIVMYHEGGNSYVGWINLCTCI